MGMLGSGAPGVGMLGTCWVAEHRVWDCWARLSDKALVCLRMLWSPVRRPRQARAFLRLLRLQSLSGLTRCCFLSSARWAANRLKLLPVN